MNKEIQEDLQKLTDKYQAFKIMIETPGMKQTWEQGLGDTRLHLVKNVVVARLGSRYTAKETHLDASLEEMESMRVELAEELRQKTLTYNRRYQNENREKMRELNRAYQRRKRERDKELVERVDKQR